MLVRIKKVTVTTALMAVVVMASLGYAAVAQTPVTVTSSSRLGGTDRLFMNKAAQGGMAKVELSQLALQLTTNSKVKRYAQQMIQDHTLVNRQLMQLASQKGVTLPKYLDAEHRALRAQLSNLSGRRFDQEYQRVMETDHVRIIALFQNETQRGQDGNVTAFASNTLPKLEGHLRLARTMLNKQIGQPNAEKP